MARDLPSEQRRAERARVYAERACEGIELVWLCAQEGAQVRLSLG